MWFFREKRLKVLKCYNFLWVQRWQNCSLAVSFANCIMTLYLLKVHLQMFLPIPVTQKCKIFSCDTCHKWEIYTVSVIVKTWIIKINVNKSLFNMTIIKFQYNIQFPFKHLRHFFSPLLWMQAQNTEKPLKSTKPAAFIPIKTQQKLAETTLCML